MRFRLGKKKVELLAPAGNYESFLGAVHAGADAVYLGGEKFGARAYADNFTKQEICSAIRYAHVYGRKVYLTVNTLVKEREFQDVYTYLLPFYDAGLDGVIIQDLGVFRAVERWFPDLKRHASTQMTATGVLGAAYLKEIGAARLVPARELSLQEIKDIKKNVDIEVETFIHGAICYCYSGQCLFSSILGGRSGNRGRCAQPCRLPYRTMKTGKKQYPLSLKDMCTIELLGDLIEAGIDSFKIEGRMKSPEYAAGVTRIYRKYIDNYLENPGDYHVDRADMEKLKALYIRSGISQGYYNKHNGKEMVTLDNPGYSGRDERLEQEIREACFQKDFRLPVTGEARLLTGEPAALCLNYEDISVEVSGETVLEAINQPLSKDAVKKQLEKTGNTPFYLEKLTFRLSKEAFLPVKALNDLRRKALDRLEEEIILKNGWSTSRNPGCENKKGTEKEWPAGEYGQEQKLHVLAFTKEQCDAALNCGVDRIYINADICMDEEWLQRFSERTRQTECYLAMPYVIRKRDAAFLDKIAKLLSHPAFSGSLVRNLEELQFMKEWEKQKLSDTSLGLLEAINANIGKHIVSDAGLYIWNKEARNSLKGICRESYLPYELNGHEIAELSQGELGLSMVVYGRIPMMVSANCVAKTAGQCYMEMNQGKSIRAKDNKGEQSQGKNMRERFWNLTDRYEKDFPVLLNCRHCYNVIYNSLPLSLHQHVDGVKQMGISTLRLDFTSESGKETEKIITYWQGLLAGPNKASTIPPYKEYTNGHWKRGVAPVG